MSPGATMLWSAAQATWPATVTSLPFSFLTPPASGSTFFHQFNSGVYAVRIPGERSATARNAPSCPGFSSPGVPTWLVDGARSSDNSPFSTSGM